MGTNRRTFLIQSSLSATGILLAGHLKGCSGFDEDLYRNKAMGCFMGAAIGDALGGPIECQHYRRIQKYVPEMQGLIGYHSPVSILQIGPGYALHEDPGCITDDSFIRADLARYFLENDPPFGVEQFANWLLDHADFSNWWGQAVRILKEVGKGTYPAHEAGFHHIQGGGGGWWQPVAIQYAGDVEKTVEIVGELCQIWKAPLERDILTAVCAGQAEAFKPGSTIDSITAAVLDHSGPLAAKLFERAVHIAEKSETSEDLHRNLYEEALVRSEGLTMEVDGPMPPREAPVAYEEGFYSSITFTEQQPWALAYFIWGKGDPERTLITAVRGGRDADSIATNTAAWLGAMKGIDVWPEEWVERVQQANTRELDLWQLGNDLVNKALERGTVKL